MTTDRLRSPAKVNLYLYVLGRRVDGYHELASLMAKLDLADEIHISPADGGPDSLSVANHLQAPLGNDFTSRDNLALRAVRVFRERTGLEPGPVRLHIEKRIPLGSGLGGGSSNAAAVLTALNERHGRPLGLEALVTLGLTLGADVPFFLQPAGLTAAGGVGEIFSPPTAAEAAWAGRPLLLVNPGLHLSTGGVFKYLGLTKGEANTNLGRSPVLEIGFNGLYQAALDLNPALAEVEKTLWRTEPVCCGLSGSGPTFWAAYADDGGLDRAGSFVSRVRPSWWVRRVVTAGAAA